MFDTKMKRAVYDTFLI